MSLVNDVSGERSELLAVLFCDISPADEPASAASEISRWRVNHFRAARELAGEYGGREEETAAGGWAATFTSTIEALMCARALSSLVGWQTGGPSLSGGLSAGQVLFDAVGIGGGPVREAICLCRQALPRQVLVADPLKMVVARETARSFAPASLEASGGRTGDVDDDRDRVRDGLAPLPGTATMSPSSSTTPPRSPAIPQTAIGTDDRHRSARGGRAGRPWRVERRPGPESLLRLVASGDLRANTDAHTEPDADPDSHLSRTEPITARTGLRLTVLGWVQLETVPLDAGRPPIVRSAMRGNQARSVLSLLALKRGPVHKEELAEMLWPDALPDHWDGAIRGLITKIRRFLAEGGLAAQEVLAVEGGYYELRLPRGLTVDRHDATTLVAEAKTAVAQDRPDDAVVLARRAVTILERRLLAGDNNIWFDQIRAELAHDRLAALDLWAAAEMAAGNIEEAKRAAIEALALDPYRESSYRLLMRAHAAAGSRGEALRTYEQCRRMLAEELGVGPAPQTQALYIHLLG